MLKLNRFKKMLLFILPVTIAFVSGYSVDTQKVTPKYAFTNDTNKTAVKQINDAVIGETDIVYSDKLVDIVNLIDTNTKNLTDKDLLAALTDDTVDKTTKALLLERIENINNGKGIKDTTEFSEMVFNKNIDKDIRVKLLERLEFSTDKHKEALEKIVKEEDGAMSVRSLRKLKHTDPKAALELSNDIITYSGGYNEDSIRAAIMTKSEYFEDMYLSGKTVNKNEMLDYIDFCLQIFENTDDTVFKDTIAFSLINMRSFDAVKAVFNHNNIDNDLKHACVARNSGVFIDTLKNNPTKEDFDFIISALKFFPINNVASALQEAINENPEFNTDENMMLVSNIANSNITADTNRDLKHIFEDWLE